MPYYTQAKEVCPAASSYRTGHPFRPRRPARQGGAVALERSEALDTALHVQIHAAGRELTTLDLPPVVTGLLMDILKETAAGKAVSLVAVDADVTTQQAADDPERLAAVCYRPDR